MSMRSDSVFHMALISLKIYSNDGLNLSQQVLRDLSRVVEFEKISSIYKIKRTEKRPLHIHDIRKVMDFEGLSFATQVSTQQTPMDLIRHLEKAEKKHSSDILHRNLSINLLAYEDTTVMTEVLTLPHPEFHSRPEILFPAAEVWGDYYHPVLKKTLAHLTRDFANLRWGEFYEQGKTLLDF